MAEEKKKGGGDGGEGSSKKMYNFSDYLEEEEKGEVKEVKDDGGEGPSHSHSNPMDLRKKKDNKNPGVERGGGDSSEKGTFMGILRETLLEWEEEETRVNVIPSPSQEEVTQGDGKRKKKRVKDLKETNTVLMNPLENEEEQITHRVSSGPTASTPPEDGGEEMRAIQERYEQIAELIRTSDPQMIQQVIDFTKQTPPKTTTEDKDKSAGAESIGSFPSMHESVLQSAKQMLCEKHSADVLNQEDLMKFYGVLEKYADKVPGGVPKKVFEYAMKKLRESGGLGTFDKYIDFDSFMVMREELDPRIKQWMTVILFMRLKSASDDKYFRRVPIILLFNYVMKKVWLIQTRLGLMPYTDEKGYISEEYFEAYLKELLPTLQQLNGQLDPVLEPFYLCAASRRFFFFLDPSRLGKVKVIDILASMLLDEVLELRESEVKETNWFSKECVHNLYRHYLILDRDTNGMLSQDEFMRYNFHISGRGGIRLSSTFVQALFSNKLTFKGEMDFRSFCDFALAMEYRKEPSSIAYFVRILDLQRKGYLNAFDLNYFYKEIFDILTRMRPDLGIPTFEDLKDEIFDMVKPEDPMKITAKDLIRCGKGDVVIGMMIDARALSDYEERESMGPQGAPTQEA